MTHADDSSQPERRLMVWKSNDLVRATMYEMSTREIKLLITAVSRIQQRHGDAFEPVVLTVRELAEVLDLERDAVYSDIKAMAETLTSRVVRIHDPNTKTHLWTNWCEVTYTEGSGCVRVLFRDALKPYLLQLAERFVRYGLDNILRLTSSYHIRLYELLKSWESWGRPWTEPLADLRRILGADAKGYDQYFIFNGSVLKPAHEAINRLTDVRFRYRPVKKGRVVTAVEFIMRPPVQPELPFAEGLGEVLPSRLSSSPTPADDSGALPLAANSKTPKTRRSSTSSKTRNGAGASPAIATRELGGAVAAHWNARMPNSPIADTGPSRLDEIARQVSADAYLHAHWRELIDTVGESKTWNGRGPRGRDGQPFHASFRWLLEHVPEVADAAAAQRTASTRKKPRSTPSSHNIGKTEISSSTAVPVSDEQRQAGAARLRRLRATLGGRQAVEDPSILPDEENPTAEKR